MMRHFQKLTSNKVTWYHSPVALSKEEQDMLVKKFKFHEHHVASTQQGKTPRPKISSNKRYVYFVFHIPYLAPKSNKFLICDLNIFLTKDTLITIESQGNLPSLDSYFESAKATRRILERRFKHGNINLFLNMLKFVLNELETSLDVQGEQVDLLNKKIFNIQEAGKFIEKISVLRYNQIVTFSAIERQSRVLDLYTHAKNPLLIFSNSSADKWNVIVETFQTLAYELSADIGHLEGLVKTFETLVTHKTNQTIKVLTVFSVVLLPLTLISGIYGMNFLYIPLADHPYGFVFTLIFMAVLLTFMLVIFRWRRWI